MLPRIVSAAVLMGVAAAWVAAAPAWAAGEVVSTGEARQWLLRMHNAATQRSYQGTLVVTSEATMSSLRIAHYCEAAQSLERVEMLDGQPREVLRHNDQVLTMWPKEKTARLEHREAIQSFPSLLTGSKEQLFDRYDMVSEGADRVAGLDAAVFLLRPRDDARFAQRLWADKGTGLLLRADVVAADGRVLETSAFTNLMIGRIAKPLDPESMLKRLDGWRVLKPVMYRTSLESEGWQLKSPVAGFVQSSCVKRRLDPTPDGSGAAAADVLQVIFSDGLTHVSVFIEPLRADRHHSGGAAAGATHTWSQAHGAHWITVVGDVPMATLKLFAGALETRPR